MIDSSGCVRLGVFLVENDLLEQARSPATEFNRPPQASPPFHSQMPVPGQTFVIQFVFASRPSASPQLRKFSGEVIFQPFTHVNAECLVFGRVRKIHGLPFFAIGNRLWSEL